MTSTAKVMDTWDENELKRKFELFMELIELPVRPANCPFGRTTLSGKYKPEINYPKRAKYRKEFPDEAEKLRLANLDQGSPEWNDARSESEGGSGSADRLGCGHYSTAQERILQKLGVITEVQSEKLVFFLGHFLEPTNKRVDGWILKHVFNVPDVKLHDIGMAVYDKTPREHISPDVVFSGGRLTFPSSMAYLNEIFPDGISASQIIGEAKCPSMGTSVHPTPSKSYLFQCARELVVMSSYFNVELKLNILSILRLPFTDDTRSDGPEKFSIEIDPNKPFYMRWFWILPYFPFTQWYDEKQAEYFAKIDSGDLFCEQIHEVVDVDGENIPAHPMPIYHPGPVFRLPAFRDRVTVHFTPKQNTKKATILCADPNKPEDLVDYFSVHTNATTTDPMLMWCFKGMMANCPEAFEDNNSDEIGTFPSEKSGPIVMVEAGMKSTYELFWSPVHTKKDNRFWTKRPFLIQMDQIPTLGTPLHPQFYYKSFENIESRLGSDVAKLIWETGTPLGLKSSKPNTDFLVIEQYEASDSMQPYMLWIFQKPTKKLMELESNTTRLHLAERFIACPLFKIIENRLRLFRTKDMKTLSWPVNPQNEVEGQITVIRSLLNENGGIVTTKRFNDFDLTGDVDYKHLLRLEIAAM